MNKIGIGVEKEIFSDPYFSFHYGYKKLISYKYGKKLNQIENSFFPYFKNINFNIIALNISKKGNSIFVVSPQDHEIIKNKLNIELINNPSGFGIKIEDLPKENKIIRQLYSKIDPLDFPLPNDNRKFLEKLIFEFDPKLICFSINSLGEEIFYDDVHLEFYPKEKIEDRENIIKNLKNYVKDTSHIEKHIYDPKRFSHIKFRVKNGEIKNIKYYRSITVDIPDYYAVQRNKKLL